MNINHWLNRTVQRTPDAPALFAGTRQVADYARFGERVARLAGALIARYGIGPGTRVAIFDRNSTAYLEALFAIWWAGAAVVPINAKLHPREADVILADADVALAIVAAEHIDHLSADCPLISVETPAFGDLYTAPPVDLAPVSADALAWLFYTSGTTGRPKGVMLAHAQLAAMSFGYLVDVDTVDARDAALYAAPLSHGAGLYAPLHVLKGARHVVPASGGFDAAEVVDLAAALGNIHMFAAPTMVRRLVDHAKSIGWDGSGVRTIVYGGGPMYRADIEEAVATLGPRFVQIYGQGESPMTITSLSRADIADRHHPRWRERLGSVGVAQACVEVRIADETGAAMPVDQTGEVLVRGSPVMQGYWRNPAATADALRGGWLWTGDLGSVDRDGYLTLKDRSKDVIISGGSNIYPREVEEVLLQHADIAEVAVIGAPSAEWGEDVIAFVVPRAGATLDPADLDARCLDSIARFKRPKAYRIVDSLPKNNYGKVLKTALRKL
jgi:long-chain acyl-CoA synthetase